MSNYVKNNLQSGEEIIIKAKINPMALFGRILIALVCIVGAVIIFLQKESWLAAIMEKAVESGDLSTIMSVTMNLEKYDVAFKYVAIALIVFGTVPLILGIVKLLFTEISVTNKRVVGKIGIIRIKSTDLHIEKVDNVTISTSFFGRIFKFYTLNIKGSGDGEGIPYKGISNANEVKNTINTAIEKHAEEARRAQAAEIANAMANRNN